MGKLYQQNTLAYWKVVDLPGYVIVQHLHTLLTIGPASQKSSSAHICGLSKANASAHVSTVLVSLNPLLPLTNDPSFAAAEAQA